VDPQTLTDQLRETLGLESPPIAIAFVDAAPAGVPAFTDDVPSSCTLWRRAEAGVFYAPAERHFNCAVGAMTMGFPLPERVQGDLMDAVGLMMQNEYITPDEPANMPAVQKQAAGILYGPLDAFPAEPDAVLLWLSPRQAMLLEEAAGGTVWTADAPARVLGRPACAAIPIAMNGGRASLSLGCTGMRTFTEVSDDRMLAVLPGEALGQIGDALAAKAAANEKMAAFYRERKAALS